MKLAIISNTLFLIFPSGVRIEIGRYVHDRGYTASGRKRLPRLWLHEPDIYTSPVLAEFRGDDCTTKAAEYLGLPLEIE
jgi:hypothetical protein